MRVSLKSVVGMLVMLMAGICYAGSAVVFPGDVVVQGNFAARSQTVAAGAIGDSQVAAAAGISASKLQHAHRAIYAQGSSTDATSATQVFYVTVGSSGTIQLAEAGAVVPATGSDTCAVDIKKGGTTVLSGTITLNSSETARQVVTGTVTSASLSAGDVVEVTITPNHTTGTLPKGVFVVLDVFEAAQ